MKADKIILIGALIGIVIAVVTLVIIVTVRGNEIDRLNEQIAEIEQQADKEIAEARREAENEKDRVRELLQDMPADIIAVEFLDNEDIFRRAEIVDGIAREVITHQLKFFREMGVELVAVSRDSVQ